MNAVRTDKSAVLKQVLSPGPNCSYSLLTLAGCSDILYPDVSISPVVVISFSSPTQAGVRL